MLVALPRVERRAARELRPTGEQRGVAGAPVRGVLEERVDRRLGLLEEIGPLLKRRRAIRGQVARDRPREGGLTIREQRAHALLDELVGERSVRAQPVEHGFALGRQPLRREPKLDRGARGVVGIERDLGSRAIAAQLGVGDRRVERRQESLPLLARGKAREPRAAKVGRDRLARVLREEGANVVVDRARIGLRSPERVREPGALEVRVERIVAQRFGVDRARQRRAGLHGRIREQEHLAPAGERIVRERGRSDEGEQQRCEPGWRSDDHSRGA